MRFKIGSLVEVSVKKKHPSWVWRCAEVVAIDRDGYTVRYYRRPGIAKEGVDKVAAKKVRPCPTPVKDSVLWAVGDVVEVLDDGYWKVSVIGEVIREDCYQIRVIGSLDEFRVKRSYIRARREWNNNRWVLVDKDSICDDLLVRMHKKGQMQKGDFSNVQLVAESSPKSLKRSFADISSIDEASSECIQKRRALSKEVDIDASNGEMCSFSRKIDFCANLKETEDMDILRNGRTRFSNVGSRIHDDAMFLTRISTSKDCEPLRHWNLTAAFIKMMAWLPTGSLVSGQGHNLLLASVQIRKFMSHPFSLYVKVSGTWQMWSKLSLDCSVPSPWFLLTVMAFMHIPVSYFCFQCPVMLISHASL